MRIAWACAAWLLGCVSLFAAEAPPLQPRLQLTNGDFYSGSLAPSDQRNLLRWQCDAAVGPFEFPVQWVSAVHFPPPAELPKANGDYCFELTGGDVVYGALIALSADQVQIDSKTFGPLAISAAHLKRVQRWGEDSGIAYIGPHGMSNWEPAKPDQWRDEAGHIVTETVRASIYGPCPVPKRTCVEVELAWKKKADFAFAIGAEKSDPAQEEANGMDAFLRNGARPAVQRVGKARKKPAASAACQFEVWNETLVVVRESSDDADLSPVMKLPSGPGRIHLQVFIDQDAGRVLVCSIEGKHLADVTLKTDAAEVAQGVRLVNRRGDVQLEQLVVRGWTGEAPAAVDSSRTFVRRNDGQLLYVDAVTYDAATREFVCVSKDGESRIPAAEFAGFQHASSQDAPASSVRVATLDGSRLGGELMSVDGASLLLSHPGMRQPLSVPVATLRTLVSSVPLPLSSSRTPRLETAGLSSCGKLVDGASQDGVSCLVWQPHGSTISSALRPDAAGKVVYRDPPAPSKVNAAARANVRNRVAVQQPGLMRAVMRAMTTPAGRKPAKEKESIDGESLWLRAGDHFPCNVVSIDERGVTFKSTFIEKTFVPHDQIKAWERIDRERLKDLEDPKRGRLLTLPRMQRSNPPTHLIQSTDGDFLRAQLTNMDAEHLNVGVRLEPKQLSRDSIARVIWFHKDETPEFMKNAAKKSAPDASSGEETETDDAAPTVAESPPAVAQADGMRLQAVRTDGVRLTFTPEMVSENSIHGQSDLLGACHVDLKAVDALLFGAGIDAAADELAYHDWRLHSATDPRFVTEDGKSAPSATGTESALVGKPAPEFELDMLDGTKFRLNEERGKIVVLDFWASWCGPCMQAMPQIHAVTEELKDQGVRLVAVNLQEDQKTAADTLERLGFAADVALDIDGAAAGKYQVTAIPQTVIVDREGKVARLFIGGGPTFADDLRKALQEVISPPATDAPEKAD